MGFYIGIDVGAVGVKAAVLAEESATDRLSTEAAGRIVSPIAAADESTGSIWISNYRRTRGRPVEATTELLAELIVLIGDDNIRGLVVAGSGAAAIAGKLGVPQVNEFKAIAAAAGVLIPHVPTLFEMGGETSKFIQLNQTDDATAAGITDYQTNGDCAAGTGSFIDQQAGRLHYQVDAIGDIVGAAERAAQIAGRCSVFAKSDMIHAQQKGYTPPEVLRGLCNAVARNFRSAVFRSRKLVTPVAFIGGVAANSAVVSAMREVFDTDERQLIVPEGYAHFVAVGAAVVARANDDGIGVKHMANLQSSSDSAGAQFPVTDPLSMHRVQLLRDQVEPYEFSYGADPVDVYLGVDVGSVSTNLVLVDAEGAVVHEIYTRTKGRPIEVVSASLLDIRETVGDRIRICGVGATGSGRELIGQLVGADTINDEITCHKTGASFIGRRMIGRIPDTIFEIGGQDSKFISLSEGVVVDFTMNEACAAGTGSFLEERAEELGIAIKGEFAEMALASQAPIRLGERCTVFMEHDVNSYMQRGADKGDVVAGLAYSIAYNYINRVVRGRTIGDQIFFQGGTAYNDAVAAAFASILGKEIVIPPHNGVMGAIGAALLAQEKMALPATAPAEQAGSGQYVSAKPTPPKTRFRGYEIDQVDYTLREFTCKGCSNTCAIQEFNVEGEKTYWGDKCSDRFRKQAKTDRKPVIADLEAFRTARLIADGALPAAPDDAPTVGIPRALYALELMPFYRTLFAHCGFRTVLSDPTNRKIIDAGLDAVVAEPCFPIIVAHGHIADLVGRDVDYIFFPSIVNAETKWMQTESHVCPWGQTVPQVAKLSPAFESIEPRRWLSPAIRFRDGINAVRKSLRPIADQLGVTRKVMDSAVGEAYQAMADFRADCIDAGAEALDRLAKTGERGIVLIGRPYNIHDIGVNLSVQRKMREFYGVNVIPLDFLDTDDIDIRDVNDSMYWNYGRKILATAKIVRDNPNLDIIYITNFKCGPDSFIKHFIRTTSGKPFLTLQFDGHSNDAGMMTRCEAYLDSKGILRPTQPQRQEQPV